MHGVLGRHTHAFTWSRNITYSATFVANLLSVSLVCGGHAVGHSRAVTRSRYLPLCRVAVAHSDIKLAGGEWLLWTDTVCLLAINPRRASVRRLSVRACWRRRLNVDNLPRPLVEGLSTPNPRVCPGHTHRCHVKLIVSCQQKKYRLMALVALQRRCPHSMDGPLAAEISCRNCEFATVLRSSLCFMLYPRLTIYLYLLNYLLCIKPSCQTRDMIQYSYAYETEVQYKIQ